MTSHRWDERLASHLMNTQWTRTQMATTMLMIRSHLGVGDGAIQCANDSARIAASWTRTMMRLTVRVARSRKEARAWKLAGQEDWKERGA
jgi:hypothetical protein